MQYIVNLWLNLIYDYQPSEGAEDGAIQVIIDVAFAGVLATLLKPRKMLWDLGNFIHQKIANVDMRVFKASYEPEHLNTDMSQWIMT